ncbi:copper amine oxidase [Stachybotrys elegans]|uniref:Amine oxidase n=1 Tax=Stachybotrys elegans TaxID=80388 RepID=A0A8K0WP39_9HYPO|nr:copper amine oxidase [Stachybotrys elegans]
MVLLASITALAINGVTATPFAPNIGSRDAIESYIPTTAPRENIFAGMSAQETKDITGFLERHMNSTELHEVDYFTNPWLLAPNKSEATAYLDGNGPKPLRYARLMAWAECFGREYMVGPLPVTDSTKFMPLTYVNHGKYELTGRCDDANATRNANTSKRDDIHRRWPTIPYDEEMTWNQEQLPHDHKAPPVAILPEGPRYEFDPEQNYVSWMDFTFFLGHGPAGISLHDIRFKGQRVIYELAMQEALAHYARPDSRETYFSYLDVLSGFTEYNLIPGYDCPSYATYTKAFCLFEFPKDYPMSRHFSYDSYHATKNIAFILRSVSTVANYDYQTTYEFYYDGSIQVLVRASGYIQGSDIVTDDAWDYGFHIRDNLSGGMHDHVLNFKVDLDILGTNNTLFKTEFVPHSHTYPWSEGPVTHTMKVNRSFITNEDQGKINWAPNAAAAYSVVNKDKPNAHGEFPGFRIYPSTGSATHLTVQNSSVFGNLIDWASHHMYVLRRKDTEPVSTSPGTSIAPREALVEFERFFDSESIEQEDIVLYFNLGMHHMPDTYDLPVTLFQGAQSGITLRPQNYQRSHNSISTRQQIHITNEDNEPVTETYGMEPLSGSYNLDKANPPFYPLPEPSF